MTEVSLGEAARTAPPPIAADPSLLDRLEIHPLTPTIGAEIGGVDLGADLPDETIAAFRAALLRHRVIFFRDQPISRARHIALGRRFGELEVHPSTRTDASDPEILVLAHGPNNRAQINYWHSDVTWRECPSMGSILRALEVPDVGGDTIWADMVAAYHSLSPAMKRFCEGLEAVHSFDRTFGHRYQGEERERMKALYPDVTHPVIRTHPETGERALYVNFLFTDHIRGLSRKESDDLLRELYLTALVPEHQVRFRWRAGSIAFWDNRSTQHYACSDYFPKVRRMERVTVIGDRPFFRAEG